MKAKPKSKIGKWSIALIILGLILLFLAPLGWGALDGAVFSSIAAFFCGIVGIAGKKDYSGWVILSTSIGFSVLVFVVVEYFFPGFWYGS